MTSLAELAEIFFWLFILIGISFLLGFLWKNISTGKKYQIFLFPGIIVHELSHALGCLITGAKIKQIKILSSKGSYVSHLKPKVPLIGNFVISFAPIIGGIGTLILSFWALGYSLPLINLSTEPFFDSFFSIIGTAGVFSLSQYGSWQFWVLIYVALSVVICLVPSKQDFKNSFLSTAFLFVLLFILLYLGIFSEQILDFLNNYLVGILGIGIFFGLLAILATIPIYFIKKIIF